MVRAKHLHWAFVLTGMIRYCHLNQNCIGLSRSRYDIYTFISSQFLDDKVVHSSCRTVEDVDSHNSLPNDKILDLFQLKAFADDTLNVT